jgi:hypothetical protein
MFVPDGFPNEKWGILGTGFSFFARITTGYTGEKNEQGRTD